MAKKIRIDLRELLDGAGQHLSLGMTETALLATMPTPQRAETTELSGDHEYVWGDFFVVCQAGTVWSIGLDSAGVKGSPGFGKKVRFEPWFLAKGAAPTLGVVQNALGREGHSHTVIHDTERERYAIVTRDGEFTFRPTGRSAKNWVDGYVLESLRIAEPHLSDQ